MVEETPRRQHQPSKGKEERGVGALWRPWRGGLQPGLCSHRGTEVGWERGFEGRAAPPSGPLSFHVPCGARLG